MRKQGDAYLVTDNTSRVTYQLEGAVPTGSVGKTVNVSGTLVTDRTPVAGADQILNIDQSSPAGMAAMHGAHGTAITIAAGVSIAALLGGLAAAGEFSSSASQ